MSNKYSKNEIARIAENLIEELRELEDGTPTTTAKVAMTCGYDAMTEVDLMNLNDALFKEARKNHIKLDMSSHKDMVEGLPFNLDFIVKNKHAQIKCPFCGSKNTARYIYGYPLFSERMEKKLNDGKWILGGCCMDTVEINGQIVNIKPQRKCNKCKKNFGKPPVLINKKSDIVEDYRDIVTSIKYFVGGYMGSSYGVKIKKNKNGALVKIDRFSHGYERIRDFKLLNESDYYDNLDDLDDSEACELLDYLGVKYVKLPNNIQISDEKWNKIVNTLYNDLYLHEWKKCFTNPRVCDGTQWSFNIGLKGGRSRLYHGDNSYPPYWDELLKIFKQFDKNIG